MGAAARKGPAPLLDGLSVRAANERNCRQLDRLGRLAAGRWLGACAAPPPRTAVTDGTAWSGAARRNSAVDGDRVSSNLPLVMTYGCSLQLDALGDPTRRAVFESLAGGPLAVVDIARRLPVTRPAVSQHLKVLKVAGLVTDRAEGTRRLYQVDREGLAAVRSYFDTFWTDALDAFRRAVEAPGPMSGPANPPAPNRSPKERKR